MSDSAAAPAVSVLLCIHNGERFLAATLDSLFAQSFKDFELVAVDDGSSDSSTQIVENYRDSRVRLIRQRQQGAAAALDTAWRAARGEYIALLDQDDLWIHNKLAIHIDTHRRRPEIELTFSWFRVISDAGHEIGVHSSRHRGTIDFQSLLTDFVIGATSNVVLRRTALEKVDGIDRTLPALYDLDLCLRVALLSPHNVLAIDQDLMLYRRHDSQVSRDLTALERQWDQALCKFQALAPDAFRRVSSQARSNMDRYFASLAYEDYNYARALQFLRKGWRESPAHFLAKPRNWLTLGACTSGILFPAAMHQKLERLAGLKRKGPVRLNRSPSV
ncbi:MAG TPA: glycosyltransferase [Bryobacteraceae bacterium]|nr:glycosyltransferase [Bryobacteraceae bacterium]